MVNGLYLFSTFLVDHSKCFSTHSHTLMQHVLVLNTTHAFFYAFTNIHSHIQTFYVQKRKRKKIYNSKPVYKIMKNVFMYEKRVFL